MPFGVFCLQSDVLCSLLFTEFASNDSPQNACLTRPEFSKSMLCEVSRNNLFMQLQFSFAHKSKYITQYFHGHSTFCLLQDDGLQDLFVRFARHALG